MTGCAPQDGKDGDPGPSGFNSLILVTGLPAGDENCPNGGNQIDTGIDNGEGEEVAGNDILEPGEIDNSVFICNGNDATTSGAEPADQELFLANFGTNNLSGFSAVSITDRSPDTNEQDKIELAVYVDKTADPDSISRIRSLIRFDGIQQVISDSIKNDQTAQIKEAVLYMFVADPPFNATSSDIDLIEFGPRSINAQNFPETSTSDDYIPAEVTWNEMSIGEPWNNPGVFNMTSLLTRDDKAFILNPGGIGVTEWLAFQLDTATVKDWRFDNNNRGIFLSVAENFAIFQGNQVNVQIEITDVLLYIVLDVENINSGGRIMPSTRNAVPWKERTEAEKFTPLQKYLQRQ